MKRRDLHRSPAECGSGAVRRTSLVHRVRAAASARRPANRKGDASLGAIAPIEDQLHSLQPICSAQRVSTGTACGAPAVAIAEIHAIDGCDQIGLSPNGNLVETLCPACLAALQCAMATYVGDKREVASQCGTSPVCDTCGRLTSELRSVFAVRRFGPAGSAS